MHFKSQHPLVYAKSELSQQKSVAEESFSTSRATCGSEREDDGQRMLNETFQTSATLPASSRRAKDITNTIGHFVVKDMLPISTTSGIEFKRLLRMLKPRYVIPHRKTFTKRTLPGMYSSLRENCARPLVPLLSISH